MRNYFVFSRALALASLLLALPLSGQVFDRNLVVNGDAEAGAAIASDEETPIKNVPGWTTAGGFTPARYEGLHLMGTPDAEGVIPRGEKYFVGGPVGAKSIATQTIDLSAAAAEIDAGRVRFYLSGFLGDGASFSAASASIKAVFQNAAGATLLESPARGPSAEETEYTSAPLMRATSGYLLPNTRKVMVTIDLTNPEAGTFSYLGADNVSLVLTQNEPITGANLVVNGDAEANRAPDGCGTDYIAAAGWNAEVWLGALRYSSCSISASDPGPVDRGQNLFSAGETKSAFQTIDITLAKDLIDSGATKFNLSGWLGGVEEYDDNARVIVSFMGASNNTLGSAQIGPVTNSDRGNKNALLRRTAEGVVPSGTRIIHVKLQITYNQGLSGATVFADNLSLVLIAPAANLRLTGIVNTASAAAGAVSPGEMVSLATTGISLSTSTGMQLDSAGKVVTERGGVKVFFDGTQAPLLFVSSSQIGAVVPFAVAGKADTVVRVQYQGVDSNSVTQTVAATAPGVFTQDAAGKGQAQAYNEGWILNSRTNAAKPGSIITILWTGGGQTNPDGVDGRMETQTLPRPRATVTVTIGGQTVSAADTVYVGAVPYAWAGLLMAQVKVPAGLNGDALPVVITAGSASSPNSATVAVRP